MDEVKKIITADRVWLDLINEVKQGSKINPREMETFEKVNHTTMCSMNHPIVTHRARDLGYKFMVKEAHWILSGDNKVSTISPYSTMINRFSDDGYFFHGAYGPKIIDQLSYICRALADDRNTRQAVLNIWRESPPKTNDVPCTISIQFIIRNDKLSVIANMRSNDVWLGWPYDNFNFSMLGIYVSLLLNDIHRIRARPGLTIINAGSRHLYKKNLSAAKECTSSFDFVDYAPFNIDDYYKLEPLGGMNFLAHLNNVLTTHTGFASEFFTQTV